MENAGIAKNEKRVSSQSTVNTVTKGNIFYSNFKYIVAGFCFGIILVKAEVISWFRIQEMFRFESFHMYGIMGTAVVTAGLSLAAIKRLGMTAPDGTPLG